MSVTVEKLKRGPDYAVMLDRRRVGTIRHRPDGWAYNPAHTKVFGDTFPSVRDSLAGCMGGERPVHRADDQPDAGTV